MHRPSFRLPQALQLQLAAARNMHSRQLEAMRSALAEERVQRASLGCLQVYALNPKACLDLPFGIERFRIALHNLAQ